jgi:hypothetical protein
MKPVDIYWLVSKDSRLTTVQTEFERKLSIN